MNITVIGAGKSGMAAAILAHKNGDNVFLTESGNENKYSDAKSLLEDAGIAHEFGINSSQSISNSNLIIVSPGVPPTAPIIIEAEKQQIPIISELEFASQQIHNPMISITGTNGKTTTTALTTFLFTNAGKNAVAAGNIGTPLSDLVGSIDNDAIIVLESSSYQLDRIQSFKPRVGMILNITPDHLSYHGSYEAYCRAKWKTSMNQDHNDLLILNADNADAAACGPLSRANISMFGLQPTQQGMYSNDTHLVFASSMHTEEVLMPIDGVRLPGVHNRYNSMAAALAARAFEIRNENIRDGLMQFSGVEHRLEVVRILNERTFINDSKATNINAAWYALSSYANPIVWIAGGRGDGNDYAELDELVKNNVRAIIAIGEEQEAIFNHYCSTKRCLKANSLEEATQIAAEESKKDDIILFSPACKSFDMFANYEHRGLVFKHAVNEL